MILGGIRVSERDGLEANSDGDVVVHALFNAISQACGGESLGYYADPLYRRGITDSTEYLKIALSLAQERGYRLNNIGIMIEAKTPCLSMETIQKMKGRIAQLVGIAESDVGITLTSGEGLTAFGRGEGILAQAVVSLVSCKREG